MVSATAFMAGPHVLDEGDPERGLVCGGGHGPLFVELADDEPDSVTVGCGRCKSKTSR